jgi:hypothetical protein
MHVRRVIVAQIWIVIEGGRILSSKFVKRVGYNKMLYFKWSVEADGVLKWIFDFSAQRLSCTLGCGGVLKI